MLTFFKSSLVVVVLVVAPWPLLAQDEQQNAAEQELQRLQGDWRFDWLEVDGERRQPAEEQSRIPLVIRGKEMQHAENKVSFAIDATTDPKIMDVVVSDDAAAGRTFEGIYKLENDTLTICLNPSDGPPKRPVEFATKLDSQYVLLGFIRIK